MAARKLLRSFSSLSIKSSFSSSSTSRLRPISAFTSLNPGLASPVRHFSSDEPPPSSPPSSPGFDPRAGAQILEGCDYQHWFVVVDTPDEDMPRADIIADYIRILATVVGSEEVAREKMYSVSTKHYFAFGALLSEEVAGKLRGVAKVQYVLPDSYLDPENQDYGGEPFTAGKATPYDRKYHAVWEQNDRQRKKQYDQQLRQQHRGPQHVASPVGQFAHGRGTSQQHVGSPQGEARGCGQGANQQHTGSPLGEFPQFDCDKGTNQQLMGSPQGEVRQLGRGRGATPNLSNQHPGQTRYVDNRYQQQNSSSADQFGPTPLGRGRGAAPNLSNQHPGQTRYADNRYQQQNSSSADQFGPAPNQFDNKKNSRN